MLTTEAVGPSDQPNNQNTRTAEQPPPGDAPIDVSAGDSASLSAGLALSNASSTSASPETAAANQALAGGVSPAPNDTPRVHSAAALHGTQAHSGQQQLFDEDSAEQQEDLDQASGDDSSAATRGDSFTSALPGSSIFATRDLDTPDPQAAARITIQTNGTPRAALMRYSPDAEGEQRGRPRKAAHGSRSERTVDQYKSRVKTLHAAAIQKRSADEQNPAVVKPMDLVDDLIESAQGENPTRRLSTFQQYRAALLWYLASNRQSNSAVANSAFAEAYDKLARTLKPPRTAKRPRKDSLKKSISAEHLQVLLNTLASMRSWDNAPVHAPSFSQLWILAILATNVRVNEWLFTSWTDDSKSRLQVYNSKRKLTHPAFALMREHAKEDGEQTEAVLSVHDLPEAALQPGKALDESTEWRYLDVDREHVTFVDQFLRALRAGLDRYAEDGVRDEEDAFSRIYARCRKTIRVAVCRAFGSEQHYSLYTMRSQWAANAKATMSLKEASIAMGHMGNTRTTRGSYAPRKRAHASPMFDGMTQTSDQVDAPAGDAEESGLSTADGSPVS